MNVVASLSVQRDNPQIFFSANRQLTITAHQIFLKMIFYIKRQNFIA